MVTSELFDLHGQVAFVTGGSRGLGLDMAVGLAEAGAAVVITARRERWLTEAVQRLRDAGFSCDGLFCDVSQHEQVDKAVQETLASHGQIDILVNNAGISWGAPPQRMPLEKWRSVLDVNATGLFIVSQIVGRHMIERRRGRIINIASIAGLRGSRPDVLSAVGYSASKGAVIALTRDLACHWSMYGITVNAIAPGFFPTRLSEGVIKEHSARILDGIPMGRLGEPDDIKGVVVFLASAAGAYITGQVLSVDGGATAW